MTTKSAKAHEVKRAWFIVDAGTANLTLGRLATRIATVLRGKHKPIYTPHVDTGDYVVVTNIQNVKVTGSKEDTKTYFSHSDHQSGDRHTPLRVLREKHPERILEKAIKGMLPKGPLGREMFSKLKVYAGPEHPHTAQQPTPFEITR